MKQGSTGFHTGIKLLVNKRSFVTMPWLTETTDVRAYWTQHKLLC